VIKASTYRGGETPRHLRSGRDRTAGLTDPVWSLRDVLLYRVPPWPQPQGRYGIGEEQDRGLEQRHSVSPPASRVQRGTQNQMGDLRPTE
jgi:hypothetical protein